jgi:large subunit ribosomal protein L17
MNHHKANRKFGREKNERVALMKSLARSLVLEEKIKTTDAKARELRPLVEKMITTGKSGTLASRRLLVARVGTEGAKKIVDTLSPRFKDRNGGYTRITKLPKRISDGSLMSIIEFV